MVNFRNKYVAGPIALMVSLVITTALVAFGAASATAAGDRTVVGKVPGEGRMTSKIIGETASGSDVTGSFTPVKFVKRNGKVFAKGLLEGTITRESGRTSMFSGMERMRVKKINGESATTGRVSAMRTCEILTLVLGPLHLDLLGLVVDLNRVVLRVTAVTGSLLGDLLCAVANLLNGGLDGLLGRLTRLLNQILGALRMGI